MGILRTDPRLTPLMETLRMIKRKTFGAIYGIDNIKLDFNQFQKYESIPYLTWTNFSFACRVIKPSIVIIVKAFKGQLVIPEFDAFTKDITEVYERYGPMDTDPRHSLWCRLSHTPCSITLDCIPNMISDWHWKIEPVQFFIRLCASVKLFFVPRYKSDDSNQSNLHCAGVEAIEKELQQITSLNLLGEIQTSGESASALRTDRGEV